MAAVRPGVGIDTRSRMRTGRSKMRTSQLPLGGDPRQRPVRVHGDGVADG